MISPENGSSQPRSKRTSSSSHAARCRPRGTRRRRLALLHRAMLGRGRDVLGEGLVCRADLPEQRAVDDEVRVAADRRGEVAVRAAREPGVAEVLRVVARLLERAQHERGKRLLPTLARADELADSLARLGRELRRLLRGHVVRVGRRRRRDLDRRSFASRSRPTAAPAARARGRAPRASGRRAALRRPRSRGSSAPRSARARAAPTRATPSPLRRSPSNANAISAPGDAQRTAREPAAPELERDRLGELEPLGDVVRRALAPARIDSACPYVSRSFERITER